MNKDGNLETLPEGDRDEDLLEKVAVNEKNAICPATLSGKHVFEYVTVILREAWTEYNYARGAKYHPPKFGEKDNRECIYCGIVEV